MDANPAGPGAEAASELEGAPQKRPRLETIASGAAPSGAAAESIE